MDDRLPKMTGRAVFAAYNAMLPAAWLAFRAGSLVHPRLATLRDGRRDLPGRVRETLGARPGPRIWFHAASYGEFEHALAVLKKLRAERPNALFVTTFFSDSGYVYGHRTDLHDAYFYSPFDLPGSVSRFVDALDPDIYVLLPGDIWPNTLRCLVDRGIPAVLADAYLTIGSARSGRFARRIYPHFYRLFTKILAVTEEDARAFSLALDEPPDDPRSRVSAVGDSRFDRVAEVASAAADRADIPWGALRSRRFFVAGSILPGDEDVILPGCADLLSRYEDAALLLVPHEPSAAAVEKLEAWSGEKTIDSIRFTRLLETCSGGDSLDEKVRIVIVDSIGYLASLYSIAFAAYVGGGFGKGVHSVLEPAAFGVPVIVGGSLDFSRPAQELEKAGGLALIKTAEEFAHTVSGLFSGDKKAGRMSAAAAAFVKSRSGAADKIAGIVLELIEQRRSRDD